MYLYNSATHKKEEFKTHTPNHVEMYTCGPTVYHFAHIGNLRSYIMEDVLEKYLRYVGYNVKRVMNITDVGHLSSDADTGEELARSTGVMQNIIPNQYTTLGLDPVVPAQEGRRYRLSVTAHYTSDAVLAIGAVAALIDSFLDIRGRIRGIDASPASHPTVLLQMIVQNIIYIGFHGHIIRSEHPDNPCQFFPCTPFYPARGVR